MLFNKRNEIPHTYSAYGYTRGGGTIWHGGIDIAGIDDDTVLMPYYNGKKISGSVVTSRIVTDKSNLTWEWGYYVCVKLFDNQTPDIVNYLYFCHNEKNLVQVGQTVTSGDAIAIMGNTGNAMYASPPTKHVHFEVRSTMASSGLSPLEYTQTPNEKGVYTNPLSTNSNETYTATILVNDLRVRTLPNTDETTVILKHVKKDETYELLQTKDGWAFIKIGENSGGWACISNSLGTYIKISSKTAV